MKSLHLALAACTLGFAIISCDSPTPVDVNSPSIVANQISQGGAEKGFTDGWEDGETVLFFYNKDFFCEEPPSSEAPSHCESGEEAESEPKSGKIPDLYVMTPIGFTPDVSTLHCPIVGSCINHPSTIDLSRVFGPSSANVPLPAHSHIIDTELPESKGNGGHAGWWELEVVGVTDPAVWDQIVAGKNLATVRALQAAGNPGITDDIPSNVFLFFSVRPKK